MRSVVAVTVGRSDWGIYRPVLRRLAAADGVALRILAAGTHLSTEFGLTVGDVDADGFGEVERVEMLLGSDSPAAVAKSIGIGVMAFAQSFAARRPDLLLVLGDRFEMFAAVAAAVPFIIPVAHIHGGERTAGAIDDALRHAMTKMSHLHFVSTEAYGRRVRQLGEEAWRVVVSGAPALDELMTMTPMSPAEVRERFGVDVDGEFALCTFHPTTLEPGAAAEQGRALLDGLARSGLRALFTMPNADPGGRVLREQMRAACAQHPGWLAVESLGARGYASTLGRASVVVGNSSSGIIEAPHFGVPVVNIGTRQDGRVRAANVVDVAADADAIVAGIARARSVAFRATLVGAVNPYGDGAASGRIVDVLRDVPLDARLVRKGFVDVGPESSHAA